MPRRAVKEEPEESEEEESGEESGSGSEEEESGSEEEESEEEEEEEEEVELAAFSTHARTKVEREAAAAEKAAKEALAKAAEKAAKEKAKMRKEAKTKSTNLILPYVGSITGVDEVELCTEEGASCERHMEDTEKLLAAFEATINGHENLITKAVALTQERCDKQRVTEKAAAVEAATLAAAQATELRMRSEMRAAITDAVAEVRAQAQVDQDKAVSTAVRAAEERAAELQRLAVQSVSLSHQRAIGKNAEELAAAEAASNFQQAAASAAAAMSFASELLSREDIGAAEPADTTTIVPAEPLSAEEMTKQDLVQARGAAGLEFF